MCYDKNRKLTFCLGGQRDFPHWEKARCHRQWVPRNRSHESELRLSALPSRDLLVGFAEGWGGDDHSGRRPELRSGARLQQDQGGLVWFRMAPASRESQRSVSPRSCHATRKDAGVRLPLLGGPVQGLRLHEGPATGGHEVQQSRLEVVRPGEPHR